MLRLVTLVLEIQVMGNGDLRSLILRSQDNYHVKLAPSFFLDAKWRRLEGYAKDPS